MASHGNHGRDVPRAGGGGVPGDCTVHPRPDARPGVVCPAQDSPEGSLLDLAPFFTIRERTYRKVLGDASAIAHSTSPVTEPLSLSRPVFKSDSKLLSCASMANVDRPADRERRGRGRSCGATPARLTSQPPIVFVGLDVGRPVLKSTGYTYRYAMKESLDLALHVHPDTRHVFIVCGAYPSDAWYENEFRSQVPAPPRGVEFTFLRGPSLRALTDRLAALPEHLIVFLVSFSSDEDGRRFRTAAVSERLASSSEAPIYTWNDNHRGTFGGRLLSSERAAERRGNSHCVCYAASDPRAFQSPLSTRVLMRSIGVSLTVGTSDRIIWRRCCYRTSSVTCLVRDRKNL